MTRSLAKIREQLTQLDAQTQTEWFRLAQTYDQYAQRLGQTLQQQAVYAVYQICTQIYPEAFLQLNYSHRQKFQQSIRTAIADFYAQFLASLKKQGITLDPANPLPEPESEATPEGPGKDETLLFLGNNPPNFTPSTPKVDCPPEDLAPQDEAPENAPETPPQSTDSDPAEEDDNFPSMQEIKAFLSQALEKEGLSLEMLIPKILRLDQDQTPMVVKSPDDLVQWHRQVEKLLQRALVGLSMGLNYSLTTQKIIPENLPPRVLEMALQAEDERLAPNREKMPHIVNLLIETANKTLGKGEEDETDEAEESMDAEADEEDDDSDEDSSPTLRGEVSRLTVINLRLANLEFSDVNLSMIRKQIRSYLNDLKKLRQQYRQLSQQKLNAEAELAWRSSWSATETLGSPAESRGDGHEG